MYDDFSQEELVKKRGGAPLKVENKKYILRDYIKLNWEISRPWVVIRAMDKVVRGSLPSLQILTTASFVNTALAIFNDSEHYKLNKQIRILQCGPLSTLPRYVGDDPEGTHNTIKVLGDGSLVVAAPLLTFVKGWKDLPPASGESKTAGIQVSTTEPTEAQKCDLLAAWYINISVRSNGVVIVKDGQTLAVGTGEQDRVGAVEQAIEKFKQKYTGSATLEGAVMSSDGFFPFADGLEVAAAAGIKAMVAPSGSLKDADVIKRANELGVALRHAPERIFSHH